MKIQAFICLVQFIVVHSLTCDEILVTSGDTKLTLSELQTVQPKDIVQCLAHIGKDQLDNSEAEFIWRSITGYFGGTAGIPDDILMSLHWVTPALTPADYSNMTFSNIDVIQNFGLNYNLNGDQIAALANRVREDFVGKEPEDFTYYDLTAIRQILCGFNRSEIERIHPSAYREAALVIGKLENCSPEVLAGFATLAVQPKAFGHPDTWSDATKQALGKVADFVSQIVPKNNDMHKEVTDVVNKNATDNQHYMNKQVGYKPASKYIDDTY